MGGFRPRVFGWACRKGPGQRSKRLLVLSCAIAALAGSAAQAQPPDSGTHLIDIGQGAGLSQVASALSIGGYELSDGTWAGFGDWYHTDWPEVHVDMVTLLGEDFGVLWGFGTGEQGDKYTIDPSLRLGFVAQAHPTPNSVLSLSVKTTLAGQFTEKPCEADYGGIGGIQPVNCRLAASFLPPQETLDYLVNADPTRLNVSISFRATF
jgi:hypothetical protein